MVIVMGDRVLLPRSRAGHSPGQFATDQTIKLLAPSLPLFITNLVEVRDLTPPYAFYPPP